MTRWTVYFHQMAKNFVSLDKKNQKNDYPSEEQRNRKKKYVNNIIKENDKKLETRILIFWTNFQWISH